MKDAKKLVSLLAVIGLLKKEFPHLNYSLVYRAITSDNPPFDFRRSSESKKATFFVDPQDVKEWYQKL